MSQIHINVGAPDSIQVPDTGSLTLVSDTKISNNNEFYIGVGIIISIILVLIFLSAVLFRKVVFKRPVPGFSVFNRKKIFTRFLVSLIIISGAILSINSLTKNNFSETNVAGLSPASDDFTITTEDIDIDIELFDEPVYKSGQTTITVNTGTECGYILSAYASAVDLVNEENTEGKISGLTTSELTTLTDNTWGFSLVAPEGKDHTIWQSLPVTTDDALMIKSTNEATPANDKTTVYYGAYVVPGLPAGTYAGTINYVAVANNLVMQDVDKWGDNVEEGQEVSAIDERDGKTYFVARLKDGNLWMTQNLDFDLDPTKIYTPDDTDIAENWTPSVSTYVSDNTTWNVVNFTPESYDPGNKYWNGILNNSFDNDVMEYISDVGDSHYHLGNYYNWTAAVAMNDSSNLSSNDRFSILSHQSICPAGWTLPRIGGGEDSFYALISEYDTLKNVSFGILANGTQFWTAPTYFSLSGRWSGSLEQVGYGGHFRSSVAFWSQKDQAYVVSLYYDGTIFPVAPGSNGRDDRGAGYPIRCMARPVTDEVDIVPVPE